MPVRRKGEKEKRKSSPNDYSLRPQVIRRSMIHATGTVQYCTIKNKYVECTKSRREKQIVYQIYR
jgi:hypothetical protein